MCENAIENGKYNKTLKKLFQMSVQTFLKKI